MLSDSIKLNNFKKIGPKGTSSIHFKIKIAADKNHSQYPFSSISSCTTNFFLSKSTFFYRPQYRENSIRQSNQNSQVEKVPC